MHDMMLSTGASWEKNKKNKNPLGASCSAPKSGKIRPTLSFAFCAGRKNLSFYFSLYFEGSPPAEDP
jgi:hypothetical protein